MPEVERKFLQVGPRGLGLSLSYYPRHPTRKATYMWQFRGTKRRLGYAEEMTEEQAIAEASAYRREVVPETFGDMPRYDARFRQLGLSDLLERPGKPGLYRLLRGGKTEYIGKSRRIGRRIGQHIAEAKLVFDDVAVCFPRLPWPALGRLELYLIHSELPPGNWPSTHMLNDTIGEQT